MSPVSMLLPKRLLFWYRDFVVLGEAKEVVGMAMKTRPMAMVGRFTEGFSRGGEGSWEWEASRGSRFFVFTFVLNSLESENESSVFEFDFPRAGSFLEVFRIFWS